MNAKLAVLFTLLNYAAFMAQDKTVTTFKEVIIDGYNNSPEFIPLTIIDGNTGKKKLVLSDTEALYYATYLEYGRQNDDSLYAIIKKNADKQEYTFKNTEALERFDRTPVRQSKIKAIDKIIKKEKLVEGFVQIAELQKSNHALFEKTRSEFHRIKDSLKTSIPNLTKKESEFLSYLTVDFYSYERDLKDIGNVADFETAEKIFNIWRKCVMPYSIKIDEANQLEDDLLRKYFYSYYKKYKSEYMLALFKYGIVFYTSDYNGSIHFSRIIE